jgi:hypothetical protein
VTDEIVICCDAASHSGRVAKITTLFNVDFSPNGPAASLLPRGIDTPPRKDRTKRRVSTYLGVDGGTLTFQCPLCGDNLQRHRNVLAPAIAQLTAAGVSQVSLTGLRYILT